MTGDSSNESRNVKPLLHKRGALPTPSFDANNNIRRQKVVPAAVTCLGWGCLTFDKFLLRCFFFWFRRATSSSFSEFSSQFPTLWLILRQDELASV